MSPAEEKTEETPAQDRGAVRKIIECLLFITEHPLPVAKLCQCAGIKDAELVSDLVAEIKSELDEKNSSVMLAEVAGGYQMATRPEFAAHVRKLFADRMTMRLSRAAHETLSIVAYKQPLTRAEIEEIRGVDVIAALETLLEKRLVKVVGRKETVGRPLMYGTTTDFLRHFGLKSLEELPPLESFAVAQPAPEAAAVSDETPSEPQEHD
ncbi:MAG: SMC-Scp complex subunit ScpB [Elusimicrobia bacterium]|nr:SMC-Scp complex subunit ScpB [Elusimicrobiota bacterium]MDE2314338.1 SMC-Scp complex subunit ScpB [Elusimicrobiota bacterium]